MTDGLFEVRVLEMPLLLRERSRQHGADLLREMALIRSDADRTGVRAAEHEVPARLLELARELDSYYAPYTALSTQEMDDALDRGEESLAEVVYHLPPDAVPFVQHVAVLLEEVEAYCGSDAYLLTLTAPPDVAAYREWSVQEVLRQAAGEPPTPWSVFAASRGLPLTP